MRMKTRMNSSQSIRLSSISVSPSVMSISTAMSSSISFLGVIRSIIAPLKGAWRTPGRKCSAATAETTAGETCIWIKSV